MARKAGKVSIFTMAAELGISTATVSRVLNNRAGVGEKTRLLVLELARKYHFRLNYPQQHQPIIATVISGSDGLTTYQGQVLAGIYKYFSQHPYRVNTIVANPYQSSPTILETLREQQCSGVIIIQPSHFADQLEGLAASGLPIMEIDDRSDLPGIGYIDNDSYLGALELTKHLISLGHRRIAFLMRWATDLNHMQRLQGYRDALSNAGIPADENWVVTYDDSEANGFAGIASTMLGRLFEKSPDITAIIGVNDEIALAAMHHLLGMGIQVPQQISVAGFDNNMFCQLTMPELTSVAHPSAQAGFLAAQAVADYLSNFGSTPLPRQILPTYLVPRKSTGPAPGAFI